MALLKQITGASEVRVFDHTLRRRVPGESDRSSNPAQCPPTRESRSCRSDGGVRRVASSHGVSRRGRRIASSPRRHRQPVASLDSPVLDAPLAVCDARSVAPQDLIASDLVFRDRRGETYNLLYNPRQRWFYAPGISRGRGPAAQVFQLARRWRCGALRSPYGVCETDCACGRTSPREHRAAHLRYFWRG